MKRVAIEDGMEDPRRSGRHILTDALGATDVAINHYRLAPGETFGGGYHTHHDQEEIFYVQTGVATFQTADGDVSVGPGEFVRFAPGEFQWGFNDGEEPVVGLGIGAPPNSGDVEAYRRCDDCAHVFTIRRTSLLGKPGAGAEVDAACPDCGGQSRRIGRPD